MISSISSCPICGCGLFESGSGLCCEKNHCFDFAKEGYVNLLPPNQKHSAQPGDAKEMVLARREFLASGKYDVFAGELAAISKELLEKNEHCNFLDIGCGEGFYTNFVKQKLIDSGKTVDVFAFDISKIAVKIASKKYNHILFAVASGFHMPVKSGSVDLAINVFAPLVTKEIFRCLKDDGYFVYAVPSRRHLFGLKKILYDEPYENEKNDVKYDGFEFIKRVEVNDCITLKSKQDIFNLFAMTPYYWKTPKEGAERLKSLDVLSTEIGFDFLVFKKGKRRQGNECVTV